LEDKKRLKVFVSLGRLRFQLRMNSCFDWENKRATIEKGRQIDSPKRNISSTRERNGESGGKKVCHPVSM
jgi:hypothetical protein